MHIFFVADQLREMDDLGPIILEPVGQDTAPAAALASFEYMSEDPLLLVMAADNLILDVDSFQEAIAAAIPSTANKLIISVKFKFSIMS